LYSFQKINNVDFDARYSFLDFFEKACFGTGYSFLRKLEARFELSKQATFELLDKNQMVAFFNILYKVFPQRLFYKNYFLLNVIFLDFSYSYRG
jgi:hypothetical protein